MCVQTVFVQVLPPMRPSNKHCAMLLHDRTSSQVHANHSLASVATSQDSSNCL